MLKKINSYSIKESNTPCDKYGLIHDFRQLINTKQGALMVCKRCKCELYMNKFHNTQDNETASNLNPLYFLPPEHFKKEYELSENSCRS